MEGLPSTQRAIVSLDDGSLAFVEDAPMPQIRDDMILVRNVAVALNPVDSKLIGGLAAPNAIAGMDFAGYVVAVGSNARTPVPLKPGDRVCGSVPGMNKLTPTIGAFSEYVGAQDLITLKLPDRMTFEEGASLGVGLGTIILALFRSLELPGSPLQPIETARKVFVYGGSTATGTLAIQFLRLSGHIPVTTCSPHNFDLVKSYGAAAVFDYHDPSAPQQIKEYTKNGLKYALDCISEPETMKFCYACIGRAGGRYTAVEPYPKSLHNRPTVTPDWVLGPAILGRKSLWPPPFDLDDNPEIRPWTSTWFKTVQTLLQSALLRTHPLRLMPGGLALVPEGLKMLKRKEVSGQKLVYNI